MALDFRTYVLLQYLVVLSFLGLSRKTSVVENRLFLREISKVSTA